eukprot:13025716-Alexandrium_andersonii.AAC.1
MRRSGILRGSAIPAPMAPLPGTRHLKNIKYSRRRDFAITSVPRSGDDFVSVTRAPDDCFFMVYRLRQATAHAGRALSQPHMNSRAEPCACVAFPSASAAPRRS